MIIWRKVYPINNVFYAKVNLFLFYIVLLTVQKSFKLIILLDSLESYPLIYRSINTIDWITKDLPIFRGIQKFEGFDHQTIVKYALDKFQIILSKEDTELIKTRFQMDWFYQVCSREIKSYKGLIFCYNRFNQLH